MFVGSHALCSGPNALELHIHAPSRVVSHVPTQHGQHCVPDLMISSAFGRPLSHRIEGSPWGWRWWPVSNIRRGHHGQLGVTVVGKAKNGDYNLKDVTLRTAASSLLSGN